LPTLCHPQSPNDFLQASIHICFVAHRSKNKVADSQTDSLETRELVRIHLKSGNYLSNNTRGGNVNMQMVDNGLGGQRDHHRKRGEL
jgi:hypothetical protein